MKYRFLLLLSVLLNSPAQAQKIYSKAYGSPRNPPIIFIHGGPRGNSTLFEGTSADLLAKKGFYVIVYDRRGEGRSVDPRATMTFTEAIDDLDQLMEKYSLKKTAMIGHSFGGILATLYAAARPQKVERLVLVGALFSQQQTYDHILESITGLALAKQDTASLARISRARSLDPSSADYRKMCYELASAYGYFRMPRPTAESRQLERQYQNSGYARANIRNDRAPLLFYQNEKRVNIDTRQILKDIQKKNVKLFGIYGIQDRIFSGRQIGDIRQLIGEGRFDLIENCSHYPFVDQQQQFMDDIQKFMR